MRFLMLFVMLSFYYFVFLNTSLAGEYPKSIRKLIRKSPASVEILGNFLVLSVKKQNGYRKIKLKCSEAPLYRLKFNGDLVKKEKLTCSYIIKNNIKNAVIVWDERNNLKEVDLLPSEVIK